MNFTQLVKEIKHNLEYLENIGISVLPFNLKIKTIPNISSTSSWEEIKKRIENCKACNLYRIRTNVVFGEGNINSKMVILTEFPSSEEDYYGKPIAGKTEELLRRMLLSINLNINDFFITPVVKCKTPAGRVPDKDEIEACKKHLFDQLRILKPRLVLAMGFTPPKIFFKKPVPFSEIRGKPYKIKNTYLFFIYHPNYLLKNPGVKRIVWEDLQKFKNLYEQIFH